MSDQEDGENMISDYHRVIQEYYEEWLRNKKNRYFKTDFKQERIDKLLNKEE